MTYEALASGGGSWGHRKKLKNDGREERPPAFCPKSL